MKNSMIFLLFILSVFCIGCDDKGQSDYSTVTVGNPGSKLNYESKLGLKLQYSEALHLEENLEKRYLQLDNRKLIKQEKLQDARLSYLRVEALQAPADYHQAVLNYSDLESFVRDRFPGKQIRQRTGLANGALGVEVVHSQVSSDTAERNEFILLQDQTLLALEVRAYPEAQGTSLVGEAYQSTSYGSGSNGLSGYPGAPEEPKREVKYVSNLAVQFVWSANIPVPSGNHRVWVRADRIENLNDAHFAPLNGGFEIPTNLEVFDPSKDKLEILVPPSLEPGEYYVSEIILESHESLLFFRAEPESNYYSVSKDGYNYSSSEMPLIKFSNAPSQPVHSGEQSLLPEAGFGIEYEETE